jgi:hypothetical protein
MEATATPSRQPAQVLARAWKRLPGKYFLLILLLCAFFKDSAFPFSNFPMYSKLSKRAEYVYVTDGSGKELSLDRQFAERAANISKAFRTNLNKVTKQNGRKRKTATPEDFEAAGRLTLAHLEFEGRTRRPEVERTAELKLFHVEITRRKKELVEKTTPAGSVRADEVPALAGNSADTSTEAEDGD